MYAVTGQHERKDGTRKRRYICANVHAHTGPCDLPWLDAERIDTAVVSYLDSLFIDFEAFIAELSRGTDLKRETFEAALEADLAELDKFDTRAGRIEADYFREIDAGNDAAEDFARLMERNRHERQATEQRIEERRRKLAKLKKPSDVALDIFDKLRKAVRGEEGESLGEVNERLRDEFEEFRIDRMEDGMIGILPVLKAQPFDVGAAYREWVEAGKPEPTEEQIEAERRESRLSEGLWVTGKEAIRPPTKPLQLEPSETHATLMWRASISLGTNTKAETPTST